MCVYETSRRLIVSGSGFRVRGSGFRVQGSGFRVQGSGFRVQGSGSIYTYIYIYIHICIFIYLSMYYIYMYIYKYIKIDMYTYGRTFVGARSERLRRRREARGGGRRRASLSRRVVGSRFRMDRVEGFGGLPGRRRRGELGGRVCVVCALSKPITRKPAAPLPSDTLPRTLIPRTWGPWPCPRAPRTPHATGKIQWRAPGPAFEGSGFTGLPRSQETPPS